MIMLNNAIFAASGLEAIVGFSSVTELMHHAFKFHELLLELNGLNQQAKFVLRIIQVSIIIIIITRYGLNAHHALRYRAELIAPGIHNIARSIALTGAFL